MEIINTKLNIKSTISLTIKREDLIHPYLSGNKYRKLKYNLLQAKAEQKHRIITYGGAFSNHIAATAYAGKKHDFETIGIIRGEELFDKIDDNPTLKYAQDCGMIFKFVTRAAYDLKNDAAFTADLQQEYGDFYQLPEGGTNPLAIKGCEEILTKTDLADFDYICCSVGTGGTIAGVINSAQVNQQILGFPALKGNFLEDEIRKYATNNRWQLMTDYHFGGYAKTKPLLIDFINDFNIAHHILLDPIYTGKMLFGIYDLMAKGFFKSNAKILAIHTGGLQGIAGINKVLKSKNLTYIK